MAFLHVALLLLNYLVLRDGNPVQTNLDKTQNLSVLHQTTGWVRRQLDLGMAVSRGPDAIRTLTSGSRYMYWLHWL